MVSIGMVVMGAADMGRAVRFWAAALGYELREGGAGADWSSLTPAGGLGTGIGLQHSDRPADSYPRVHLDLYAADAAEQAAEVERLVSLGAEKADWDLYPEDPDFVVLADPEGNRFCIVNTSHGHEWPACPAADRRARPLTGVPSMTGMPDNGREPAGGS